MLCIRDWICGCIWVMDVISRRFRSRESVQIHEKMDARKKKNTARTLRALLPPISFPKTNLFYFPHPYASLYSPQLNSPLTYYSLCHLSVSVCCTTPMWMFFVISLLLHSWPPMPQCLIPASQLITPRIYLSYGDPIRILYFYLDNLYFMLE